MKKYRNLASIPLFGVGALIGLYGVTLVLGVGGDNGDRADYIELGGHHVRTYLAGAVALAIAVALVGVTFALRRRLR